MDLFSNQQENAGLTPLPERCRPRRLEDFVGHSEIIGEGSVLRKQIEQKRIRSLILWGPPGVGKTTLAQLIAHALNADFIAISAVTTGVADVRKAIERARRNRQQFHQATILFIDEIHRFNKAQQDALLHAVEDGTIILIGATTENPSFEVIAPLLSRCQVYQMNPLKVEDIRKIVERCLQHDGILKQYDIRIKDWQVLYKLCGGDARRALSIVEKSLDLLADAIVPGEPIELTVEVLEKAAGKAIPLYDKSGEAHYDFISAFIKSLRGSDPDAAIFWMARMLAAGEDPKFIARRMVILAAEDIGNADPYALTLATSCFTAVTYVGMPEAQIILSQVAAYLAAAPKSNAAIEAINRALADVQAHPNVQVPLHLRNAPTSLLKSLGYGKDYQYVHDFPEHFVKTQYLPDDVKGRQYYLPSTQGQEKEIRERLARLWKGMKTYSSGSSSSTEEE